MTFLERLEEMGERLFHSHQEQLRAHERQMRGTEDRHEQHTDQTAGSEFLDVM